MKEAAVRKGWRSLYPLLVMKNKKRRNRQTLWGDGVRMLTQKLVAKRYMIA